MLTAVVFCSPEETLLELLWTSGWVWNPGAFGFGLFKEKNLTPGQMKFGTRSLTEHFLKRAILGDKRERRGLYFVSLYVGVSASSHSGSALPSLFWRQRLSKHAAAASSLLANANRHLLLLSRWRCRDLAEHLDAGEPWMSPEGRAQCPSANSHLWLWRISGCSVQCKLHFSFCLRLRWFGERRMKGGGEINHGETEKMVLKDWMTPHGDMKGKSLRPYLLKLNRHVHQYVITVCLFLSLVVLNWSWKAIDRPRVANNRVWQVGTRRFWELVTTWLC